VLLGNYSVLNKSPGRFLGGSTTSVEVAVRSSFNKSGANRNVVFGEGYTTALSLFARPTGYAPSATWMIPMVRGQIGTGPSIIGSGSMFGSGALGVNQSASLTGAGDITSAIGALVVSAIASLIGSGDLSATMIGKLEAAASLAGSGDLSGAIGALASLLASLTGAGALAGTPYAIGSMGADITVSGAGLSTANVGQAVWEYLISGTEAQDLLAAAGSAGDPWITALPGAYAAGTAGHTVGNLLTSIGTRMIEGGMSQDAVTRIMLAALSGTTTGIGTATEVYKSADGLADRITATFDAQSNRTTVIKDGA